MNHSEDADVAQRTETTPLLCGNRFTLRYGYSCQLPRGHKGDHWSECPNPFFSQSWSDDYGEPALGQPHWNRVQPEPMTEEQFWNELLAAYQEWVGYKDPLPFELPQHFGISLLRRKHEALQSLQEQLDAAKQRNKDEEHRTALAKAHIENFKNLADTLAELLGCTPHDDSLIATVTKWRDRLVTYRESTTEQLVTAKKQAESEARGLRKELKMQDGECFICKQPTSSVSGNPRMYPIRLLYRNGNGKWRLYHSGCVTDAVADSATLKAVLEEIDKQLSEPFAAWRIEASAAGAVLEKLRLLAEERGK